MVSNVATSAIMSAGMKCLKEKMGVIEAEIFISVIKENDFDYTEWRRDNLFIGMPLEEICKKAAEYEKNGSKKRNRYLKGL